MGTKAKYKNQEKSKNVLGKTEESTREQAEAKAHKDNMTNR